MITTQYINLNMVPAGVLPVMHVSQFDIGRPLGVVVYDGSAEIDLDDYTVTIEATRTDGTPITAAVTTDGNIGAFVTTATMTNKDDLYPAQLVIVDGDSNRVASLPFMMSVVKAAMDENSEAIEEDAPLYQQYNAAIQALIVNEITAEAAARQAADNTLQNNINTEAATRAAADNTLQAQINQIIAPSGEAPSAAEVENARIGADGVTYPTLGDAIRTNDSLLKSQITNYNSYNILHDFGTFANGTSGGVTYTWNTDHTKCTAVGTTTGTSVNNVYNTDGMPNGMIPGRTYGIKCETTDENLLLELTAYSGSTTLDTLFITESIDYTIPNNCTKLRFRIRTRHTTQSPSTVNASIFVAVLNAKSNAELTQNVNQNAEGIDENANKIINLMEYNSYDILREVGSFADITSGGVTYTWDANHAVCTAVGTTNALSICNLYAGNALPAGMVSGEKYYVKVNTTDTNLLLEIIAYNGSTNVDDVYLTEDTVYTVPQTATRLTIRIRTRYTTQSPSTVNDTISVAILNAKSNANLTAEVEEIADRIAESLNFMQIFPKYTTIGDSLMGGFMNRDGVSVNTETAKAAGNNWVNYIAIRIGRTFTNLAKGGSTAKEWRESLLTSANIDTDCYLVGIGVNDHRDALTIGSASDIKTDFNNNTDSFYGNYDFMVRQLMAWKPTAHIFCFTIPTIEGGTSEDYNTAIRYITALYPSKVHCIDLATEQAYNSSIITDNYTGRHFNPIAYNYMSGIIENAINEYMKNNDEIFATAPYQ